MRFEAAFMSERDDWETPQKIFDELDSVYHFTLDPCSTDENAKCEKHYTSDDDGLSKSWRGEVVFVNPPYGKEIAKWAAKCHEEAGGQSSLVCSQQGRTRAGFMNTSTALPRLSL